MNEQSLLEFVNRVSLELGATISLARPARDTTDLPLPLQPFYAISDGLELPFAELHSTAQLRASATRHLFGPTWLAFGFDGFFTHYLVSTDPGSDLPITAFDPEVEQRPEGAYTSVLELLDDEYSRFVDNDLHSADLHVTSIPPSSSLPSVVQELKHVAAMPTSELLRLLRSGPFVLDAVNAATGIAVVRTLHALGVGASLQNVRAEDAG